MKFRKPWYSLVAAVFVIAALLASCNFDETTVPGDAAKAGWIDRLEIASTVDAYGGVSFGATGQYQVLRGIVSGKLNPMHPANAGIADINLAPVGADGMINYSTDIVILRPKSAARAKRIVIYDGPNLGRWNGIRAFNDGPVASSSDFAPGSEGNGFLMRQGYTIVSSGWQGDMAQTGASNGALGTVYPVARNTDGTDITGFVRQEFIFDNETSPVTAALLYEAASTANRSEATLDWRQTWVTSAGMTYNSPSTPVSATDWEFASPTQFRLLTRPPGSDAGSIYSLIYRATKPKVMGMGFAAVRDLMTFLRYDDKDRQGNANPLNDLKSARCVLNDGCPANLTTNFDVAIVEGVSQPGAFGRGFLWQGFNDDTRGGKVFDGMLPVSGGSSQQLINARWARAGGGGGFQHENHWGTGNQFPFAYSVVTDAVTGITDGLLKKCLGNGTCPKIIQIDTATEFWQGRASLLATNGASDIAVADNVRLYFIAGTRHAAGGSGPGTEAPLPQAVNPHSAAVLFAFLRALLVDLEEWVTIGTPPPPSQWPTIASGMLADPSNRSAVGFPDLTSVFGAGAYSGLHNQLFVTSYANAIPVVDLARRYTNLVPTTDADGNEKSGVRGPDITVPLAAYTGWNPRKNGFAGGEMCGITATANNCTGSTLRFAANAAERIASGDPRLAVTERYTSKADYIGKVKAAAEALVTQRLLLQEDVQRYVDRATTVAATTELP